MPLVRYRGTLIRQRAKRVHRIQKVLEGANINLASGRAMWEAMVAERRIPLSWPRWAGARAASRQSAFLAYLKAEGGKSNRTCARRLAALGSPFRFPRRDPPPPVRARPSRGSHLGGSGKPSAGRLPDPGGWGGLGSRPPFPASP